MPDSYTLYVERASPLHTLHPLTKLTLAGFLFVAALALPGRWPYAVFALAALPLAAWGGVLRPLLGAAWRAVLPFAVSVFVVQGLFWPGGTAVLALGPLALKSEGLLFAVASTGRILAVVGGFLVFALTTRPDRLMIALAQRGLGGSVAYIIVSTIQIIPRFQVKAEAILNAQRARGLETEGSLLQRARGLVPLVAPLLLGSLVDVEERALAVEARAFNHSGPKTSLVEVAEAAWEPGLRWALLAAAGAVVVLGLALRMAGP